MLTRKTSCLSLAMLIGGVAMTAAAPVLAQTAPNVTIYGRAHLSLDALGDGDDTGTNVSSNSSRLGFRANTEVQPGLKAFMQIETNIRYDEGGGSTWASRDSFVGLSGDDWGQVRIGQFDTPLKTVRGKVDMFGDRIGDIRNLTRTSTSGGAGIGNVFDERYRNGVAYRSPKFAEGFTFDLHYTPSNTTGGTVDNIRESYSTSLSYEVKGLYLAAAYEYFEGGTSDFDPAAFRLGAYYDIGDLRLAGMWQSATDVPGGDRDVYGIGASYKMGDWVLRGQLYQAGESDDVNDNGATMYVVGVDRNFGRALTLYFAYGATNNDDLGAFRVSAGGRDTSVPTVPGETATALSLGVVYSF